MTHALADPHPSNHLGKYDGVYLSSGSVGSRLEAGTLQCLPAAQAWVPAGTPSALCVPHAGSCWWTSSTSTMLARSTVVATMLNACAHAAKPVMRFVPLCPGVGVEGGQGQGQALLTATDGLHHRSSSLLSARRPRAGTGTWVTSAASSVKHR